MQTDVLGNTYAILNPKGSPKVMLAGHCDEIGFLVSHINGDGYIYFNPIGGHDANITVGQRVFVHTQDGPLLGVIGKKPIHLMEDDERGRKTVLHDLFVDIGAQGKSGVAEKVAVGDPITYAPGFATLQGDLAVSHAFDDKISVYALTETVRLLKGRTCRPPFTASPRSRRRSACAGRARRRTSPARRSASPWTWASRRTTPA